MKTYDYLENVKEDVRNYIEENKIVVTSIRKNYSGVTEIVELKSK